MEFSQPSLLESNSGRADGFRCKDLYALPNALVQLRAVGSICALKVAIIRSQQALNRNDFLRSRARQLQRVLARVR